MRAMRFSMLWAIVALRGLGPEAVDEGLQPLDLLGLALRRLGHADLVLLAGRTRYWL